MFFSKNRQKSRFFGLFLPVFVKDGLDDIADVTSLSLEEVNRLSAELS
jgi:hypothetical protein